MIDRQLVPGTNSGSVGTPVGSASAIVAAGWVSVRARGGGSATIAFQRSANPNAGEDVNKPPPGTRSIWSVQLVAGRREWAPIPSGTEFLDYDIICNGPGYLSVELQAR